MRVNRAVRNQIEARYGQQAIDELERWNDSKLDPLDDLGVELPLEEEVAQQATFESLARRGRG